MLRTFWVPCWKLTSKVFNDNLIDFEVDYLFEINHMFVDVVCGNISHMYVDFWCLSLYRPIQWTLIILHSLSRTKR